MFISLVSLDGSLENQDELTSGSLDPMIEGIDVVMVSLPSLMLSPNLIASLLHASKDVIFGILSWACSFGLLNPNKNQAKSCSSLSLS